MHPQFQKGFLIRMLAVLAVLFIAAGSFSLPVYAGSARLGDRPVAR